MPTISTDELFSKANTISTEELMGTPERVIPQLSKGTIPTKETSPEQRAEEFNTYAISKATGMPMSEVKAGDLTQKQEYTGIMREPTIGELVQSQATLYGSAAMGAALVTNPLGTLTGLIKGLPGATVGYAIGKAAKPFERITPEEAPRQIKEVSKLADELISMGLAAGGYKATSKILGEVLPKIGLSGYAKNKTLAIRKGSIETYKKMQDDYGKELNDLVNNPDKVDPTNAIGKIESMIEERMPIKDINKGTRLPPTNRVDSALLKSYNRLYSKWANSKDGKLTVGDIASELKTIKDSGGSKDKVLMRSSSKAQGEILESIKGDINVPKFQAMQGKYREGMNQLEAIDKHFDIWEDNKYLTEKGEKFIKQGIYKSAESQTISNLVSEKAGQTLKLGKVSSRVSQVMGNKILMGLILGAGAVVAGGAGIKALNRRE